MATEKLTVALIENALKVAKENAIPVEAKCDSCGKEYYVVGASSYLSVRVKCDCGGEIRIQR